MKPITTLLTLLLAGFALAQQSEGPHYFSIMALRSASPLHFGSINAAGGYIWIGKDAATYCPQQLNNTCPNSTQTVFAGPSQYGGLSLGVVVPGGQQVYIDPTCGAVSYTRAHSAYMPIGANATGWTVANYGIFDYLTWAKGTVFCPTGNGTDPTTGYGKGPWKMYAQIGGNVTLPKNCLGASLLAMNQTESNKGPGAWQYT